MRQTHHDDRRVDPIGRGLTGWVGGKRHLAQRLVERIERIPHRCYAEPFLGMGGVFFRRRRRMPVEAINDRHGEVSNLFRMLRQHPQALMAELALHLNCRADYDRGKATAPSTLTELQRAARFYHLQKLAFRGRPGDSFGSGRHNAAKFSLRLQRAHLMAAHRRLERVTIEGLDFEAFIRLYDGPETLFFCDPPYWGSEDYYGPGLFEGGDFERLARVLAAVRGRVLLTINDRPETRSLFKGFRIETVRTVYHLGGRPKPVTELLISNGRSRASAPLERENP